MAETFEQYVARLLGYLGDQDPLQTLAATPARISRLVDGLSEARLRERTNPAKWSLAEIAIHLSEVELVVGYRVRSMLGDSGGPIQAYDQEVWAKRYDRVPVKTAIEVHRTLREANLALYRSLTQEEWARYGIHSERGKETVDRTVRLQAGHDLNHLKQLEALKG